MADQAYDVIVVGARCAGSPLAMLLARQGHRVLLVDRATFPSDTVSTHVIHPPGVAALRRWGLLDQVVATGCPPVGRYSFDFGPIALAGAPGTADVALRVRAAAHPARQDPGGRRRGRRRRGPRGVHRRGGAGRRRPGDRHPRPRPRRGVRCGAGPRGGRRRRPQLGGRQDGGTGGRTRTTPPLTVGYYSYWSNLPTDTFEAYSRPGRGWAVCPTNDGLTLVIGGWPHAELADHRNDVEAT